MFLPAKLSRLPVSKIARFTAVVAIAMAAGHLAQSLAAHKPAALPKVAVADEKPTHIVQLSSGGESDMPLVRINPEPHLLALERPSMVACNVDLSLTARPLAMIAVELSAPCRKGERIVLRQAALAFTDRVGVDGKTRVTLPSLTTDGTVTVLFGDGAKVEDALVMPEAVSLRRFAVQWQGTEAFGLHGIAEGADFDQPGDISSRNLGNDHSGILTVLGDATVQNPLLAEVYTYPVDATIKPQIVLEAAVLPATCGHDLVGEVLTSQSGQVHATELTLAMPDCSGIGDFLVLKNLASDVKVAAN